MAHIKVSQKKHGLVIWAKLKDPGHIHTIKLKVLILACGVKENVMVEVA
jgi:hypothetical protein